MIETAALPTVRYVQHVMGMPISLALRGRHTDDGRTAAAWADTMAELRVLDRIFSTYRRDSHVSRLDSGVIDLADCPAEVAEVIALGEAAEHASGGAFSVRLPGADGVPRLEPSGVVKGWAVDRAAAPLRALPDTDFCLSAGGDMVCRTHQPNAAPWRIGVEHPADPMRLVAVIPVLTGAVATSGATHRGQHIVDPRTGRPATGVASVTVVGDSLTWADIDATAAYAMGVGAVDWLSRQPILAALVVADNGTTTTVLPDH